MSAAPVFLSLDRVLAIHQRMVQAYGGRDGLRDRGLLESAIAMPQATFSGELLHPTLSAQAAAYLFQLCRNHPLVGENKRTALATSLMFLLVNGHRLNASKPEVEQLTLGVAAGQVSKESVIAFFEQYVVGDDITH